MPGTLGPGKPGNSPGNQLPGKKISSLLSEWGFSAVFPYMETEIVTSPENRRRPQSHVENYHHFVWATHRRQPLLSPDWERAVYRCIQAEVTQLQSKVLALNGMPDHVHLVVRLHSTVTCARLANQVKGVSSRLLNTLRDEFSEPFRWQDGYACFSLSRSHLPRVIAYVEGQKGHHANDKTWPQWEPLSLGTEMLDPETVA